MLRLKRLNDHGNMWGTVSEKKVDLKERWSLLRLKRFINKEICRVRFKKKLP